MIISGGENIYPSEIENILGRHPGVKDVAVVGVPHEKWGEAVHAVIVLHAGTATAENDVLEWCRDKMAGYKRPRSVSSSPSRKCRAPRPERSSIACCENGTARGKRRVERRSEQRRRTLTEVGMENHNLPSSVVAAKGRAWWLVLLRGIAALVFGVLA
jgi:acyl-CoA synthetase (AMP-forming)/AMP-acid ligase II